MSLCQRHRLISFSFVFGPCQRRDNNYVLYRLSGLRR